MASEAWLPRGNLQREKEKCAEKGNIRF